MDVVVTDPDIRPLGNHVHVKVPTNQPGHHGCGDTRCSGSELAVAKMLEGHLASILLRRGSMQIGNLRETLYDLPYSGSGAVHMSAICGIDMAHWHINGKAAGLRCKNCWEAR